MIFFFTIVVLLIIIGIVRLNQTKTETEKKSARRYSNEEWETWREAQQQKRALMQQKFQDEWNNLIGKYGDVTVKLKLKYNEFEIKSYLLAFEQSNVLVLFAKEYKFSDVLGFSLVDDATSETITTSSGDNKTSTGSVLGRAAIGAIALGGVGALAGASTAKRNISVNSTSQTTTTHKYRLYINVNSLENPTISVLIGEDSQKAYQLANLFNVIVERGRIDK